MALGLYLDETGDASLAALPEVRDGLSTVWEAIQRARVGSHGLCRTFLLPSDDPAHHPFVTYDLALLWRGLRVMGRLGWSQAVEEAEELRAELYRRAVVSGPFGAMWAWSFDEEGHYLLYDEPPGSLALLAYYDFCAPDDPVYLHTLRWIWSSENPHLPGEGHAPGEGRFAAPACPHAPHLWVMSLANALLVPPESCRVLGRDPEEFRRLLEAAPMDGGLACETIGLHDGWVHTGAAFATCAGFLAWALAVHARRGARCNGERAKYVTG
ncbi:MAG TPA: glycoside hydrolase family 125 protein [Firmicutes bacterium]|nr:glycoside hydrolase family 125 protein [Bacillota bacterium]